jgi:hypothetical protein
MVLMRRMNGANETNEWCLCDDQVVLMRRLAGANATRRAAGNDCVIESYRRKIKRDIVLDSL